MRPRGRTRVTRPSAPGFGVPDPDAGLAASEASATHSSGCGKRTYSASVGWRSALGSGSVGRPARQRARTGKPWRVARGLVTRWVQPGGRPPGPPRRHAECLPIHPGAIAAQEMWLPRHRAHPSRRGSSHRVPISTSASKPMWQGGNDVRRRSRLFRARCLGTLRSPRAEGGGRKEPHWGVPGFVSYTAFRSGDGGFTVTVCQDKTGTDESSRRAAEWVKENVSATTNPPVITQGSTVLQFSS